MSVTRGWKEEDEYLGEKDATSGAPRLPSAFATERLLTDNRGGFPFGGHRLSSLYRTSEPATLTLTPRYFSASFSHKYSPGAASWSPLVQEQMAAGWKTPVVQHHKRAHHA
jgi:hypothetical protein